MAKRVLSVVGVLLLAGATTSADGKRSDCPGFEDDGSYDATPTPTTASTPAVTPSVTTATPVATSTPYPSTPADGSGSSIDGSSGYQSTPSPTTPSTGSNASGSSVDGSGSYATPSPSTPSAGSGGSVDSSSSSAVTPSPTTTSTGSSDTGSSLDDSSSSYEPSSTGSGDSGSSTDGSGAYVTPSPSTPSTGSSNSGSSVDGSSGSYVTPSPSTPSSGSSDAGSSSYATPTPSTPSTGSSDSGSSAASSSSSYVTPSPTTISSGSSSLTGSGSVETPCPSSQSGSAGSAETPCSSSQSSSAGSVETPCPSSSSSSGSAETPCSSSSSGSASNLSGSGSAQTPCPSSDSDSGSELSSSGSAPCPSGDSDSGSVATPCPVSASASESSASTGSSTSSSSANGSASSSVSVSASGSSDYSSWSASTSDSGSDSASSAYSFSGSWSYSGSSSDVVNWVGTIPEATDSACYRKTHIMKTCPTGYSYDNIATCWAQCPIDFPVECGMECLPQNADCTTEIITKIASVANVAIEAATAGVFGDLATASSAVQTSVKCAQKLYNAVETVLSYSAELKTSFPDSTTSQLEYLLSKVSFVTSDLTSLVSTCLGDSRRNRRMEEESSVSTAVASVVTKIVSACIESSDLLSSVTGFVSFLSSIDLDSIAESLTEGDLAQLETLLSSDTSCGFAVQAVVDEAVTMVTDLKTANSDISTASIRLAVSSSDLFQNKIPLVTTECMTDTSDASYSSRASIRKALLIIIDKIIDTGDSDGTLLLAAEYAEKIADLGLDIISTYDTTGLAALAEEYIQPICGPTVFIGEVSDGDVTEALGLTTDGDAFEGSTGTWTKSGDGSVVITFVSSDTKDVTVEIHSAGDTIASVKVKSGETVTWTSTVAELADKTMYLDRWRPGILGIPGSGGGSLVTWISRSSEGGRLEITAHINVS